MELQAVQEFWQWFKSIEDKLFNANSSSDDILEELSLRLATVERNIGYEICSVTEAIDNERPKLLIISAGSDLEGYSTIRDLVDAAPILEHWLVQGFRPRRKIEGYFRVEDVSIPLNQIRVSIRPFGCYVAVNLYFPDLNIEEDLLNEVAFTVLELALGELDLMGKVGPIEVSTIDSQLNGEIFSLADLPAEFDHLCKTIASRFLDTSTDQRKDNSYALHKGHLDALKSELLELSKDIPLDSGYYKVTNQRCSIMVRCFSYSLDQAKELERLVESEFEVLDSSTNLAPSIRGEGWVVMFELDFKFGDYPNPDSFFERLLSFCLATNSDLDLFNVRFDDIRQSLESLPMLCAGYLFQEGSFEDSYEILEAAETEFIDDIEYWSMRAYIAATLERSSELRRCRIYFMKLLKSEDHHFDHRSSIWQMACATAIAGEVEVACDLISKVIVEGDNQELSELLLEVEGEDDLARIRGTKPFKNLLDRLTVVN